MGGLRSTNVELSTYNNGKWEVWEVPMLNCPYKIMEIHGKFEYGDALWGSMLNCH